MTVITILLLLQYFYSAEVEWPGLVNAMSGLVCAHLNDIGPPSTFQPHYSFQPQGAIIGIYSSSLASKHCFTTTQTETQRLALYDNWNAVMDVSLLKLTA